MQWTNWLHTLLEEGDRYQGEAELLVQTINHCSGSPSVSDEANFPHHQRLSELTNRVCHQLRHFQKQKVSFHIPNMTTSYLGKNCFYTSPKNDITIIRNSDNIYCNSI